MSCTNTIFFFSFSLGAIIWCDATTCMLNFLKTLFLYYWRLSPWSVILMHLSFEFIWIGLCSRYPFLELRINCWLPPTWWLVAGHIACSLFFNFIFLFNKKLEPLKIGCLEILVIECKLILDYFELQTFHALNE